MKVIDPVILTSRNRWSATGFPSESSKPHSMILRPNSLVELLRLQRDSHSRSKDLAVGNERVSSRIRCSTTKLRLNAHPESSADSESEI